MAVNISIWSINNDVSELKFSVDGLGSTTPSYMVKVYAIPTDGSQQILCGQTDLFAGPSQFRYAVDINGLSNGRSYKFKVRLCNSVGEYITAAGGITEYTTVNIYTYHGDDEPVQPPITQGKVTVVEYCGPFSAMRSYEYHVGDTHTVGGRNSSSSKGKMIGWSDRTNSSTVIWKPMTDIVVTHDIRMYAVWEKEYDFKCYYIDGNTGQRAYNARIGSMYTVQESTIETTVLNAPKLPQFIDINKTVTTSEPHRTWNAIGWRDDTDAYRKKFDANEIIDDGSLIGKGSDYDFYAVYTASVTCGYNSNGGHGTMKPEDEQTIYYSASGEVRRASFDIDRCLFDGPNDASFVNWNTKADASGTTVRPNETLETAYNTTLYAIWSNQPRIVCTVKSVSYNRIGIGIRIPNLTGEYTLDQSPYSVVVYGTNKETGQTTVQQTGRLASPNKVISTTVNMSSLQPSTEYSFEVQLLVNGHESGIGHGNVSATTDDKPLSAKISKVAVTDKADDTSAYATFVVTVAADVDAEAGSTQFEVSVGVSSSTSGVVKSKVFTLASGASKNVTIKVENMRPNWTYEYEVKVYKPSASSVDDVYTGVSTSPKLLRFTWHPQMQRGMDVATTEISTGKYRAAFVKASEWLRFKTAIQKAANDNHITLDVNDLAAMSNGVSSGQPMKSEQPYYAIELLKALSPEIEPPAPPAKNSRITAALFLGLQDSINSVE